MDRRGRVVYQYERPFRDSSTHIVLESLNYMARMAALVPSARATAEPDPTARGVLLLAYCVEKLRPLIDQ
jgi:hypothetical protein